VKVLFSVRDNTVRPHKDKKNKTRMCVKDGEKLYLKTA